MKIGFIGLGNMASAIIDGILKSGSTDATSVFGSDQSEIAAIRAKERFGIQICRSNVEVADEVDVLFLAVKPQFLADVLQEISSAVTGEKLVICMAAGKTLSWLEERLLKGTKVVRIMPNTSAIVGESCTAVCKGTYATDADVSLAEKLCQAFGSTYVVNENLMDVFGAIGGASPAFAFLYMEALADGAVANGMSRQMAYEIAAQATMGAAKLMKESKKHPGELKDMVCSPGGTTIEGVSALERNGFRNGVIEAIKACVEKSRKL